MAIDPSLAYPGQTATGDAGYPYGKPQNVGFPGDGTGTPWEEKLVRDWFGYFQSLLVATGISPSGVPDKVGASQYLTALRSMFLDIGARNWRRTTTDITNFALDTSHVRTDGTAGVFWSEYHASFMACGNGTNGVFYRSFDGERWEQVATFQGIKYSHGVEAIDRLVLFDFGGPNYARSGAGVLTGWVTAALPDSSGLAASSDAVYLPIANKIIVVGARVGTYCAWVSTNQGGSFTSPDPILTIGTGFSAGSTLHRIIIGKNERVFAFDNDTTAHGGNTLFWSDDGTTWHSVTLTPGIDRLSDGCYSAELDRYVFASATNQKLYVFQDPTVVGSETVVNVGGSVDALQCFGGLILAATTLNLQSRIYGSRDLFASSTLFQRIDNTARLMVVSPYGKFVIAAQNEFMTSLQVA
jgi:hypothetical protein